MSFKESCYFLGKFVQKPTQVAAIWPSSRHLAQAMIEGQDVAPGDLLVEYGPGTGAFTNVLHELMRRQPGLRYVGFEREEGFVRILRGRFPGLRFEQGNVEDMGPLLGELGPAKLIVSGLPLISFPDEIIRRILLMTRAHLAPGGSFRTFSYVHSKPTGGIKRLKRAMDDIFGGHRIGRTVFRNMPPAYVLQLDAVAPVESGVREGVSSGAAEAAAASSSGQAV